MKKRFINIYFILILLLVLLSGCKMDDSGSGSGDDDDNNDVVIETDWTDESSNSVRFFTNDPLCSDYNGTTFWKIGTYQEAEMKTITVKVSKTSGYRYSGYGIIFCVQDSDNFLTVLIDTQRGYTAGKVVDGEYTPLIEFSPNVYWGDSEYLTIGYGVSNEISVNYDESNNFTISFNGHDNIITFNDSEAPFFTGGYYGYIATVSPYENFPNEPVEVYFEPVNPVDIGLDASIKSAVKGTKIKNIIRSTESFAIK